MMKVWKSLCCPACTHMDAFAISQEMSSYYVVQNHSLANSLLTHCFSEAIAR